MLQQIAKVTGRSDGAWNVRLSFHRAGVMALASVEIHHSEIGRRPTIREFDSGFYATPEEALNDLLSQLPATL